MMEIEEINGNPAGLVPRPRMTGLSQGKDHEWPWVFAAGFARQLLMPAGAVLPCRRQGHTVPEMDILECAKVETVRQFGSDSVLA